MGQSNFDPQVRNEIYEMYNGKSPEEILAEVAEEHGDAYADQISQMAHLSVASGQTDLPERIDAMADSLHEFHKLTGFDFPHISRDMYREIDTDHLVPVIVLSRENVKEIVDRITNHWEDDKGNVRA